MLPPTSASRLATTSQMIMCRNRRSTSRTITSPSMATSYRQGARRAASERSAYDPACSIARSTRFSETGWAVPRAWAK
jgi:hypothetical protein